MDALSQLSYTPVTKQNDPRMVSRTSIILTNLPSNYHPHEHPAVNPFDFFSANGFLDSL
jgi:hypothetical protein